MIEQENNTNTTNNLHRLLDALMLQSPYIFPLAHPILSHVVYSLIPTVHLLSVNPQPFSSTRYILSAMFVHSSIRLVPEWSPMPVCVTRRHEADFHVLSPSRPRTWYERLTGREDRVRGGAREKRDNNKTPDIY